MAIYRVEKNKNYVVLNRTALNDERLSWKAKGIIAYMLSMPDNWKFYIEEIASHAKDGVDSLRSGIKELSKYGYVKRFPIRDEKTQKIIEWETVIYESPQSKKPDREIPHMEKPYMENPQVEKPLMEKPTLLSIDELNTDELSIEELSIDIPYVEIINYLNDVAGKNFRPTTKKTKNLIKARWNEGFRFEDFKTVIDNKVKDWKQDPHMNKYLRPETLFGTKFESYLNENSKPQSFEVDDQFANLF
jgi:uncharacterized phage protein (TIGR02220 family)